MKKIVAILVAWVLLFSICSCSVIEKIPYVGDLVKDLTEKGETAETKPTLGQEIVSVAKTEDGKSVNVLKVECVGVKNDNYLKNYSSYRDDNYYYYFFKLGTLCNVKLEAGSYYNWQGALSESTLTFTNRRTSESSIQEYCENSITDSMKKEQHFEANANVEFTWGSSSKIAKKEIALSVGLTYGNSRETTHSETVKNSLARTAIEANLYEESQSFKLNSNCPSGCYAYVLLGIVDVYATVAYDFANDQYSISQSANIVSSGRNLTYFGSVTDYAAYENYDQDLLEFETDENIETIKRIASVEPQNKVTDYSEYVVKIPEYYDLQPDKSSVTVADTTQDGYFKFDLSELKRQMRAYGLRIVKISLSVYVKEENDGYQELYLVNQSSPNWGWEKTTHKFSDSEIIYSKDDIETDPSGVGKGTFSVDKVIDLSLIDLSNNFILYCGANGKSEDTWTASKVQLRVYFNTAFE